MKGTPNMPSERSPGQVLAEMLSDNLAAYRMGPVVGDRERRVILGVTPDGSFVDGMTLDGFIAQGGRMLLDSGRVYRFGNTVVYETNELNDPRLTTLAVQHRAEPAAAPTLANLFGVGCQTKQGAVQSLAPARLVGAVLADETLWRRLPEIKYHARRPTFDLNFDLCRTGWNPPSGILVHAPEVVPTFDAPHFAPNARALDRLPPFLRRLFREFSWRSDADLVNALAMPLTGLLINHFIDAPHPGGIVDANQPEIGKTLLVQCFGRILDAEEPPRISVVRDDELEKKLCAQLQSSVTSLFFLDNVRARIESAVIEQNMLSPVLSFRVLGRSATIQRPNTFLWMITSNLTAGTPDLIRRCVPIRLFYEGDPKCRTFSGDPLGYATGHRPEILGELAGMVLRWVQQGKPLGPRKHRCGPWAATIGGILGANGLGEFFLANADEAEAAMDQGLMDLATLAEHVVSRGLADLHANEGDDASGKGLAPGQWVPVFTAAQVMREKLAEGTTQGRSTAVGIFLGGKLNRAVTVETSQGPRKTTLRRREAGANQKLYYFELAPPAVDDRPAGQPTAPAAACAPEAPALDVSAFVPVVPLRADGGPAPDASALPGGDATQTVIAGPPGVEGPEWL